MSDSTTPPAPPDTSAGDGWALRQGDYIMWAVHPYDSYTKWERARFDHWAAGGHPCGQVTNPRVPQVDRHAMGLHKVNSIVRCFPMADEAGRPKRREASRRSTRGVVSGTRPAPWVRAPDTLRHSDPRPARAGEVAGYEAPHFFSTSNAGGQR